MIKHFFKESSNRLKDMDTLPRIDMQENKVNNSIIIHEIENKATIDHIGYYTVYLKT